MMCLGPRGHGKLARYRRNEPNSQVRTLAYPHGSLRVRAGRRAHSQEFHVLEQLLTEVLSWCKPTEAERGNFRATPQTYPRLISGGNYVVSASEDRRASIWTFSDGRLLCTLSDERRIFGDFYAAVCDERLVLIGGKCLKIYDLTVHAGYKRTRSEGLGVSLRFIIEPDQFALTAQEATGKARDVSCVTVFSCVTSACPLLASFFLSRAS